MHLTAPVIYFAVKNSKPCWSLFHTTEDLNTVSITGHLMCFHTSTVLDYTEKSKIVRHIETKGYQNTDSVAAFHLAALPPPHLLASLKMLKLYNLKMLKFRHLPVTTKSLSTCSSASYHHSKFVEISNRNNFTSKIWIFFLVNTSLCLHFSALSLNKSLQKSCNHPVRSRLIAILMNDLQWQKHKPPKMQLHGQPSMLSDLSGQGNRI